MTEIRTEEELHGLPEQTVLRDAYGEVWEKFWRAPEGEDNLPDVWRRIGDLLARSPRDIHLPAKILREVQ